MIHKPRPLCLQSGGVFYVELNSRVDVVNSELLGNKAVYEGAVAYLYGAVAGDLASVTFDGCTLHNNSALEGGVAFSYGSTIVLRRCVVKYNIANRGAVVCGAGNFELDNCAFLNNTALEFGGIVYSSLGTTSFVNSDVRFSLAQAGSVTYSTHTATTGAAISVLVDRSSFLGNAPPAIVSATPTVIRNTQGLSSADITNVPVQGCADSETMDYCNDVLATCSDVLSSDGVTLLGISCYCHPDGEPTDPSDASCASSASMSDPFAGVVISNNEEIWVYVDKPDTGRLDIQFSNLGDVRMLWELFLSANPAQLAWNVPHRNGSLAAGEAWSIPLQLISSAGLQARDDAYITSFTLNARSPEPTPIPESRSVSFNVHTVVLASPDADLSYINITNLQQLTAAGTIDFDVTSVDGTGMVILDAVDVAYSAALVHSASSASVACSALYDTSSKRHKGVCNLQGLEAGGFELKVQLGSDLIGGGAYHITVDGCTDTFELSDDGLSCTCPAGRYELGNVCAECADGTHKPAPGTERADCIACVAPQTSNAARTACDACISGYYRKGVSCAPCPNGKQCTTTSDRGALTLAPGYWRGFGESTTVLACRFGITSCPGDKNAATSVVAPDPYCAPGFVGPLCSECETSYFLT